jgi:putative hydrolase of HD superfamily
MDIKKIVNFIFELNQLKRQKHSGWFLAGVANPPSVAEHQLRAAQIGYILAELEGANAEKVACMLLLHDNAEARTGDQNKVSARYFQKKDGEERAFQEQIDGLGAGIEKKWRQYFDEIENRSTKEGIIAKDADWLEMAFQAKEYLDLGHGAAIDWIDNVEKAVETKSAKEVIKVMKKTEFTDWWQGLKKMTYVKLKK